MLEMYTSWGVNADYHGVCQKHFSPACSSSCNTGYALYVVVLGRAVWSGTWHAPLFALRGACSSKLRVLAMAWVVVAV